jgi:hypothetical protein
MLPRPCGSRQAGIPPDAALGSSDGPKPGQCAFVLPLPHAKRRPLAGSRSERRPACCARREASHSVGNHPIPRADSGTRPKLAQGRDSGDCDRGARASRSCASSVAVRICARPSRTETGLRRCNRSSSPRSSVPWQCCGETQTAEPARPTLPRGKRGREASKLRRPGPGLPSPLAELSLFPPETFSAEALRGDRRRESERGGCSGWRALSSEEGPGLRPPGLSRSRPRHPWRPSARRASSSRSGSEAVLLRERVSPVRAAGVALVALA